MVLHKNTKTVNLGQLSPLVNKLSFAFFKRFGIGCNEIIKDSIVQTLYHFKSKNLICDDIMITPYKIFITDEPVTFNEEHENECNVITDKLYQKHFPELHSKISKGEAVNLWELTCIKETVRQTVNYLKIEGMLNHFS